MPGPSAGLQNPAAHAGRGTTSIEALFPCAIAAGSHRVGEAEYDHHVGGLTPLRAESAAVLLRLGTKAAILQSVHAAQLRARVPVQLHEGGVRLCEILDAK